MASSSSHDTTPARSSSGAGEEGVALKKGPWTAAENAILFDYVSKHGEGNWNAVQRNSGLQRCGKSCRLRWANHLRPNLKKGAFTPEEERLILELHAKLGNKWARMAAQMPGRTDNEIKNYWNTRMKRHQRAGLAIYPTHIHTGHHRQHRLQRHRKQHHALKSTSHTQMLDFPNQGAVSFNQTPQPQSYLFTARQAPIPSQFNFFMEQSNSNSQSYQTSLSPAVASHSLLLNNNNPLHLPPHQSNHHQDHPDSSADFGFVHLLSSNDASATTAGCDHRSNGMLDDVFYAVEFGNENSNSQLFEPTFKNMKEDEVYRGAVTLKDTTPENSSSGLTSIGVMMVEPEPEPEPEPVVEINPLEDELTSLIDSFPAASPTPQWYRRGSSMAEINNSSSDANGGEVVLDLYPTHQLIMPSLEAEATDQVLSLGGSTSMLWHELPSIY